MLETTLMLSTHGESRMSKGFIDKKQGKRKTKLAWSFNLDPITQQIPSHANSVNKKIEEYWKWSFEGSYHHNHQIHVILSKNSMCVLEVDLILYLPKQSWRYHIVSYKLWDFPKCLSQKINHPKLTTEQPNYQLCLTTLYNHSPLSSTISL